MTRTIMLVGAPEMSTFEDEDLTVKELIPAFQKIVDSGVVEQPFSTPEAIESVGDTPQASEEAVVWRSIPAIQEQWPTGWSQPDWIHIGPYLQELHKRCKAEGTGQAELSFLTCSGSSTENKDSASQGEDGCISSELSQHLEQSFALHEDAPSSQVAPAAKTPLFHKPPKGDHPTQDTDADAGPDTLTSLRPDAAKSKTGVPPADPKTPLTNTTQRISLPYLTDLSTLPTAQNLTSLEPQTVTVDLLAGVISIGPLRTVTIRRTGRETSLIEVLVGDDTRAGFMVTFWLPQLEQSASVRHPSAVDDGLRGVVQSLRPGDVVALRNVALGQFRGRVLGQTLGRRGRASGETQVWRVCRVGSEARRGIGGHALEEKLGKVWRWTRNFVRPAAAEIEGSAAGAKKRKREPEDVELPLDETQEPSEI